MRCSYEEIYGGPADRARLLALRDALLADGHSAEAVRFFIAPGRTELGGNHTDHQHGLVLAAAVDVDTVAAVAPNGENVIRLRSEGFPACEIFLDPARNPPCAEGEHPVPAAGQGACRVHGGDFAGTAQVYVPRNRADSFRAGVEEVLGTGSCQRRTVRAVGAAEILL